MSSPRTEISIEGTADEQERLPPSTTASIGVREGIRMGDFDEGEHKEVDTYQRLGPQAQFVAGRPGHVLVVTGTGMSDNLDTGSWSKYPHGITIYTLGL
ncbi:hypothetical protein HMN09_01085600 [Mycena chlorophos]|uniref:Uncharacterized protein n=1 Tax=Mycena chlorophos TaxID=658473 RepID=A0A8H6SCE4_MYCCL|nr:hypothetical protein HMN09_01085600 [Mycena chlorophos]